MRPVIARSTPLLLSMFLFACGSDKPRRPPPQTAVAVTARHHDYSSTWVYAVGEVDSPAEADCKKALGFIVAESDCIGKACLRGSELTQDFGFACSKLSTSAERAKVAELRNTFNTRAQAPATACLDKVDTWLGQGCGDDGACEPRVQRWATQCAATTGSKLLLFLLERMIENSFREPRRVKLDARGCDEFARNLAAAASCSKPFDCEDAMPKIDEYILHCAQGPRKAVALSAAVAMVRMRLGAEKAVEPIALTDDKAQIPALAGTIPLVDKTGVVYRVCGEPVSDLKSYLEQRGNCQNGTVTLLRAVATGSGQELSLYEAPHDSDDAFQSTAPSLRVDGEAEARADAALKAFSDALRELPEKAASDFTGAMAKVNDAFGKVSPKARQSANLRAALSAQDTALAPLFAIIGDSKVRVAGTRLSDEDLVAFLRRSEAFVFADMSKSGNVAVGSNIDLSELLTKNALPTAYAAYDQKLAKLRKQVEKRKITLRTDVTVARAAISAESRSCATEKAKMTELVKSYARCLVSKDACSGEERAQISAAIASAKAAWREARVRELNAKVTAAQPIEPSAVCSSY